MEWMVVNELREKYLSFFESKGHLRHESFSLVPQGDKSLLLINAGMAPLKKYFTGELTPPKKRMTTCQKCIRTPDIERVGITARHGTYFEMLGNFSFGDYFKHEAIPWAWEFCTQVLQMPVDKLWVTVYQDDDEAYDIWAKDIGVDESHIVRLGKEDNFWEHGAGPCGPCSEIYFDRGEKYGCGSPDCKPGCDCDRYTEFWNLVFTQFDNDGSGNYSKLKSCNIDTGMGLERLACIMQGVDNLFEIDTVQNIMKHIISIANVNYHENESNDISLRVITDHIRSTTFMISDGVMPSNEGRGYVLRRLLRRAARHGRLLGVQDTFLWKVAETVISENANAYPNLVEKHDLIIKVIKAEEESFAKTIDAGLSRLEECINSLDGKVLSGEEAFKLQDTFGFPIDLTKELLEEKGYSVDIDSFNALVQSHRELARSARKDAGAEAWKSSLGDIKGLPATKFVGYDSLTAEAEVLAIICNGEKASFAEPGDEVILVLNNSSFYAESGGQVGDKGIITFNGGQVDITNTTKTGDGVILHHGTVSGQEGIAVSAVVCTEVDCDLRQATMRNHTAAHLLQAALRRTLGTHVEQAGQLVDENNVRFDFTHFSALSEKELKEVELLVNAEILKAYPVTVSQMPIEEAKAMGAMALFGEKYGDVVRVVKAGDFSTELCGGTHVSNTGNVGLFKIKSESSVAAGVRRIEAVTGFNSIKYLNEKDELINSASANLKLSNSNELAAKALAVNNEIKQKDKEIERLSLIIANMKANALIGNYIALGSFKLVVANIGEGNPDEVRKLADLLMSKGSEYIGVIACTQSQKGSGNICVCCGADAKKGGVHAGKAVKEIAMLAGGNGGGKPDYAMAGIKNCELLSSALDKAEEIIQSQLK